MFLFKNHHKNWKLHCSGGLVIEYLPRVWEVVGFIPDCVIPKIV